MFFGFEKLRPHFVQLNGPCHACRLLSDDDQADPEDAAAAAAAVDAVTEPVQPRRNPQPLPLPLLKYMCTMGLNLNWFESGNGYYLGRRKLTGIKKDMGQGLMPYIQGCLFYSTCDHRTGCKYKVS